MAHIIPSFKLQISGKHLGAAGGRVHPVACIVVQMGALNGIWAFSPSFPFGGTMTLALASSRLLAAATALARSLCFFSFEVALSRGRLSCLDELVAGLWEV